MKTYFLIAFLGLGCRSETSTSEGTVVGNPGDGAMRAGDGVDFQPEIARTSVSTMFWQGCGGTEREISVDAEIDLLGDNQFTVPVGNWCAVVVSFNDSLFIEGPFRIEEPDDEEDEFWLQMELDPEEMIFVSEEDGFDASEEHFVIEFGEPDWYDPAALLDDDLLSEEQREALREGVFVVNDEHSRYDEMVDRLENSSSLFIDSDGNGQISDAERDDGPVAQGDSDFDDDDDDDDDDEFAEKVKRPKPADGCGSGGGNALLLLPFGWLMRRRAVGVCQSLRQKRGN